MKLCLTVVDGKLKGQEIPIKLKQFVIGRDPQCHLRPASPLISKRHCAITIRDAKVYVHDFDSTNGTFVNKQGVKGEIEVRHGDALTIGPLNFQIKIESSVAVDTPTPMPSTAGAKTLKGMPDASTGTTIQIPKVTGTEEDTFADLLLNTPDDSTGVKIFSGKDPISPDSTVLQAPALSSSDTKKEAPMADSKPLETIGVKKEEAKKVAINQAATSDAARAILEKYMKRPRPSGK